MQPQRLRRFAAHVLFMWLFALATGFVNACVVKQEARDGAAAGAHRVAVAAMATHEGHEAGAAHDHGPREGNPPCQRFCDAPSALTQVAKQETDSATGFWVAAPPPQPFVLSPLPDASHGPVIERPAWRTAVPIPIAFLRLAL